MVKLIVKLTESVTVEGEGDNLQEAMMAVGGIVESYRAIGVLGGDPEEYLPQGRSNTQGQQFFTLTNKDDKVELKLGQRQDGSGLFPSKKDGGLVPVWKPDGNASGGDGGGSWPSS